MRTGYGNNWEETEEADAREWDRERLEARRERFAEPSPQPANPEPLPVLLAAPERFTLQVCRGLQDECQSIEVVDTLTGAFIEVRYAHEVPAAIERLKARAGEQHG